MPPRSPLRISHPGRLEPSAQALSAGEMTRPAVPTRFGSGRSGWRETGRLWPTSSLARRIGPVDATGHHRRFQKVDQYLLVDCPCAPLPRIVDHKRVASAGEVNLGAVAVDTEAP